VIEGNVNQNALGGEKNYIGEDGHDFEGSPMACEHKIEQFEEEFQSLKKKIEEIERINTRLEHEQRVLRKGKERLLAILAKSPIPTAIFSSDGELVSINEAMEQQTGYSRLEIVNKESLLKKFFPDEEYRNHVSQDMSRALTEDMKRKREVEITCKNDTIKIIEVCLSSFQGGYVGQFVDVTDRKRDEEEKERLRSQLYQADKMNTVGQLAAGIAHEINNPISFVLPNLQLLKEQFLLLQKVVEMHNQKVSHIEIDKFWKENEMDLLQEDCIQMFSDCQEGARRIRDTSRELRQFSRMEDVREYLDLEELLESSLAIAANEIKYRARVIKQYENIPRVSVHRSRMSQVFLNIIVNAAQAIEEGHDYKNWIKLATGQKGDKVFVEISNSGELIPEEELRKIFDPFYSTKPQDQGTGLGLSITYSIVQQHKGWIEVQSSPKTNTVFRIWLPIVGERQKEKDSNLEAVEKERIKGRVLVVDDEEGIQRYLRRSLELLHEVTVVQNGRQALELLEQDRGFDVILCDLMMPDLSGMNVFEAVEDRYQELTNRFIFMTGGAFTPRANEFVLRVKNPKLEKPIEHDTLLDLIDSVIQEHAEN
jgi:PAS domain S-box-containing protein